MNDGRKTELVRYLVEYLVDERARTGGWMLPPDMAGHVARLSFEELWPAFRALVNTREPLPASDGFLSAQDELLGGLIADAGVTQADGLAPVPLDSRLRLWRGDITTLAVEAIVNAANAGMTGCWHPLHGCIDNAIHTYAGVQLRAECAELMRGCDRGEPTGSARITRGYNLPARYVLHTVGPIVDGPRPSARDRADLASCYRSCLELACARGLRSVAFCCISTGEFRFPCREAARIAVREVRAYLDGHAGSTSVEHVVFDVFTERDLKIYRGLLGEGDPASG